MNESHSNHQQRQESSESETTTSKMNPSFRPKDAVSCSTRYKQTVARTHNRNRVFGVGEAGLAANITSEGSPREANARRSKPLSRSPIAGHDRIVGTNRLSSSLLRMAEEQKAKKVRFYRNGDRFFKGMVIAVSTHRFRSFESLLNSLTVSPLCDKNIMPRGVRHVFSVDGTKHVDSLDQLEDGESYVCASTDVFRSLDYAKNESPAWNRDVVTNGSGHRKLSHSQLQQQHLQQQRQQQSERAGSAKSKSLCSQASKVDDQRSTSGKLKSSKSEMSSFQRASYESYMRSFVVPRLITVVRQGKKPRRSVRLLLNTKTAKTIEQVLEDIAESIKLDCGVIKKLFSLSGRRVSSLKDFFAEESVFLACGTEKPCPEDFVLDAREVRQVHAYRLHNNSGGRARVTLRVASRCSPNSSAGTVKSPCDHSMSEQFSEQSSRKSRLQIPHKESNYEEDETEDSKDGPPKIPMPLTLTNKYEIGNVIGTGNFAVVFECKEKKTKKNYALKIVSKSICKDKSSRQEKMIDNEVRILRRLNHPNIIRLVEDYAFQQRVFYIMDLVKGGDLFDAICSSRKYTEQDAGSIVFNLASALDYLHSLKIVHRDVKPENILIRLFEDGTKSLKLGDFGLATEVKGQLVDVCGTPSYVAPEVIAEIGYNTKVDIWSMGVITYILLCGFPPFVSPEDDQEELFDLILAGNVDFPALYWDCVNSSAKELILSMLDKDQNTRFTAAQVLDHTWIVEDTAFNEDLYSIVSSGLSTNFRRSTHSSKQRGIQVMTKTVLDRGNRYFRGRGLHPDGTPGHDT